MSTTNKSKSKTMSDTKFWITSATLAGVGVLGGAMAGLQPSGAGWRLFSYHPFLVSFALCVCLCVCVFVCLWVCVLALVSMVVLS